MRKDQGQTIMLACIIALAFTVIWLANKMPERKSYPSDCNCREDK